jgi:hypothetical protein
MFGTGVFPYITVMPGLVPGIHVLLVAICKGVDGMRNSGKPELRNN